MTIIVLVREIDKQVHRGEKGALCRGRVVEGL